MSKKSRKNRRAAANRQAAANGQGVQSAVGAASNTKLKVDPEFRNLIPPLRQKEYEILQESIRSEGCRDPIITWEGVIVDGHNRYGICKAENIPFKVAEVKFSSKDEAKAWILKNQIGRRNLSDFQRCELILRFEHIFRAEAKRRQGTRTDLDRELESTPCTTRDRLGQLAGVSGRTMDKVAKLIRSSDEELKRRLRAGEISISAAYKRVCGESYLTGNRQEGERLNTQNNTAAATAETKIEMEDIAMKKNKSNRTTIATQPVQKRTVSDAETMPVVINGVEKWSESRVLNSSILETACGYQRPIRPKRVNDIVNQFNPNLVNPVKVSFRDGKYFVFDGGHTLAALKRINGGEDCEVDCRVFYGLTFEEEAELFAQQNGLSQEVGFGYLLRARYLARDPAAVDFYNRTTEAGFRITVGTSHRGGSYLSAIKTAYGMYEKLGPEKYSDALRLAVETWGAETWVTHGNMINGLKLFYMTYGDDIKKNRFVRTLSKHTETSIEREANKLGGGSVAYRYAMTFLKAYNYKLSSGALDKIKLFMSED